MNELTLKYMVYTWDPDYWQNTKNKTQPTVIYSIEIADPEHINDLFNELCGLLGGAWTKYKAVAYTGSTFLYDSSAALDVTTTIQAIDPLSDLDFPYRNLETII